jgi:hypothetical protein
MSRLPFSTSFFFNLKNSAKLLFEAAEIGYSGLANRRFQFCRDTRESRVLLGFDPLIKRRLDGEEARTTTTLKVGAAAKRSN